MNKYFDVDIVTLIPATEAFELRTVLLIGNFGDYPKNVLDIIQKTHVDAIHFSISKNIKNIDNFSFGQDRIIDERKIQDILSLVAPKNM